MGVLGGTFNPPHLGHLALARNARDQLSLERVMLIPARLSPHKSEESDPGPEHRFEMCRLAVMDEPAMTVSPLELEREGPSYTVDTLTAIRRRSPDAELTFILGADVAGTIASWHEPARLLELAGLAVASRNGSARTRVLEAVRSLDRPGGMVTFLDMDPIEVSSSTVRRRVREGESIDQLVGAPVARYIAEHGLYTTPSREGNQQ